MGMGRRVGVLSVALGLVVVGACDGGGGGGGGSGAGSVDSFIIQYCDAFAPCCSKVQKPYDQAKCRALITAFLPPNQTYDAAKGQRCIDAVRSDATRAEFCDEGPSDAVDPVCEGVISTSGGSGTKAPGELCESDNECAGAPDGEAECASSFANGATTRACQIQTRGKENDPCGGTKDGTTTRLSVSSSAPPANRIAICYTADQLHCDSASKTCKKLQDIGGECTSFSDNACVSTAFCDSATRKCVPRKAIGEDCSGSGSSTVCLEKSACDAATKKCVATLARGAACTQSTQCEDKICVNGKCGSSSSSSTAFICAQ